MKSGYLGLLHGKCSELRRRLGTLHCGLTAFWLGLYQFVFLYPWCFDLITGLSINRIIIH